MKTTPAHINDLNQLRQTTFADSIRTIDMKWIWAAMFMVIVLVLKVLDPLQAVAYLIENEGLGEEGATVLGMVAGFTFPLTLGFSVIMYFLVSGQMLSWRPEKKLVAAASVLLVSGFVADAIGFGLLPAYGRIMSGPFWLAFPLFVVTGYLTSYGVELTICAFVIGTAAALQLERWLYNLIK
jgi:hypothetical protein